MDLTKTDPLGPFTYCGTQVISPQFQSLADNESQAEPKEVDRYDVEYVANPYTLPTANTLPEVKNGFAHQIDP